MILTAEEICEICPMDECKGATKGCGYYQIYKSIAEAQHSLDQQPVDKELLREGYLEMARKQDVCPECKGNKMVPKPHGVIKGDYLTLCPTCDGTGKQDPELREREGSIKALENLYEKHPEYDLQDAISWLKFRRATGQSLKQEKLLYSTDFPCPVIPLAKALKDKK